MAQASRDIKRRIKSVGNTKKITKAMEMVSAAKMRRAVAKVLSTRAYADLSWQTVLHLAKKIDTTEHPFFQEPDKVKKIGVVLIGTNRGLCGSFNANLVAKLTKSIKAYHPDAEITDLITCGSKGRDEARRRGLNLIADFNKTDITQDSLEIRPLAHLITKDFINKKYDKIYVAYTDFESALKQAPHITQLLPIAGEIDKELGHVSHEAGKVEEIKMENFSEFIFEPGTKQVLDAFLPRLVEVMIYQAVLESEASEHSARMVAMRNASDAAEDMVADLTLAYNKARQAGITNQIAEIAGGAAALE